MRFRLSACVLTLLLGVALVVSACGSSNKQQTPAATPAPTPTPRAILDAASARWGQVKSAHYTLTIDGNVYLDDQHTLALRGAQGDLLRPNSATAKANISLAGANVSINMIAVGNSQFITNPITGKWQQAPQGLNYNPSIIFDPQNGIQGVLRKAQDLSLVGNEQVNGAATQHLRGKVARAAVTPMTGNAFKGDPIDFDIWVTKDTRDIVKIVLHDTASDQGASPATWTLLMSKLNSPVTIATPQT